MLTSVIAMETAQERQVTLVEEDGYVPLPNTGDRIIYENMEHRVDGRTFTYYEGGCVVGILVTKLKEL